MPLGFDTPSIGEVAHGRARDLWPICRSLTGPGVRETLAYLKAILPGLQIHEVASGTKVFDWTVPREWHMRSGRLTGPDGKIIADFADNNLHVVGYSVGVDTELSLEDLQGHLYSLPDQPEAIPYITSYYNPHWGFCVPQQVRDTMQPGTYRAVIDADHVDGVLNYADLVVPGKTDEEVLISTYVCHPSMANNELSGPVVATAVAEWIAAQDNHYTYRFVFVPETIGAIAYIHERLEALRAKTVAGYVLTCIGDDRSYSFMPSREDGTLSDRAGRLALASVAPDYEEYSFLTRGSDERQYCSPGVDLPIASIMRTKYTVYPEYHTSLDDLTLVTPSGLQGGFEAVAQVLAIIDNNRVWKIKRPCEPQLGARGLYPSVSTKNKARQVRTLLNINAYADGTRDFIDLCQTIEADPAEVLPLLHKLIDGDVLEEVAGPTVA
ncbi:DUF4910 domain-containing protein [Roseibium porphyridii]|uniref:DUF4910 domain-containing protein n=1 Tax=Roseibium porphyridii TaxID=2866279 RepID=A0ABY8F291_9HYPH|nr:DUF4910 domain-containing protein [Roseibium sp. KMA01]WFE89346.1 DUF4910 domain-containing protein [Roseibium sp. KMA01]